MTPRSRCATPWRRSHRDDRRARQLAQSLAESGRQLRGVVSAGGRYPVRRDRPGSLRCGPRAEHAIVAPARLARQRRHSRVARCCAAHFCGALAAAVGFSRSAPLRGDRRSTGADLACVESRDRSTVERRALQLSDRRAPAVQRGRFAYRPSSRRSRGRSLTRAHHDHRRHNVATQLVPKVRLRRRSFASRFWRVTCPQHARV